MKKDTRTVVAEMRAADPDVSASEMAEAIGVSRERVRQHLVALGLPTQTLRGRRLRGQPKPRGSRGPARGRARVGKVRTGGVMIPTTARIAGVIGELLAAADLTARGYTVYAPICRHAAHADLVALKQGEEESAPITVEVRCGARRIKDGVVTFARKITSKATHHAIVITGDDVVYDPPLDPTDPPNTILSHKFG